MVWRRGPRTFVHLSNFCRNVSGDQKAEWCVSGCTYGRTSRASASRASCWSMKLRDNVSMEREDIKGERILGGSLRFLCCLGIVLDLSGHMFDLAVGLHCGVRE